MEEYIPNLNFTSAQAIQKRRKKHAVNMLRRMFDYQKIFKLILGKYSYSTRNDMAMGVDRCNRFIIIYSAHFTFNSLFLARDVRCFHLSFSLLICCLPFEREFAVWLTIYPFLERKIENRQFYLQFSKHMGITRFSPIIYRTFFHY